MVSPLEGLRRLPLWLQRERTIQDIGELLPWVKVFACGGTRDQCRDVHDPFLACHTFEVSFQKLRALDGLLLGAQEPVPIRDACQDNPSAPQWHSSQRGLAVIQAVRWPVIIGINT